MQKATIIRTHNPDCVYAIPDELLEEFRKDRNNNEFVSSGYFNRTYSKYRVPEFMYDLPLQVQIYIEDK